VTEKRVRADELLVIRGLAASRSQARALILARNVRSGTQVVDKAGTPLVPDAELTVTQPPRFVSRGGEKLDHAISEFALDVTSLVCADFGASTGGFTDVLLQHGAAHVYAVDVGYGQLAYQLRTDERVTVIDRTNARYLEALPDHVDLVTIDVSFISLSLILPAAKRVLKPEGCAIALVKPQFEAGKDRVGRGGVVRDPRVHRDVLQAVLRAAVEIGFSVSGLTASPITGPAGNVEFLTLLTLADGNSIDVGATINDLLNDGRRLPDGA
jgi:23S rRNA (cytidine1920-2'-O)/16S rRNA (cytidine1409-2'-O)-methyltransferase